VHPRYSQSLRQGAQPGLRRDRRPDRRFPHVLRRLTQGERREILAPGETIELRCIHLILVIPGISPHDLHREDVRGGQVHAEDTRRFLGRIEEVGVNHELPEALRIGQ
jgi:hypothetical protein